MSLNLNCSYIVMSSNEYVTGFVKAIYIWSFFLREYNICKVGKFCKQKSFEYILLRDKLIYTLQGWFPSEILSDRTDLHLQLLN